MKIVFIRHGMTQGNQEKRYIGATDESLCSAGIHTLQDYLKKGIYPSADRLFVSPMRRCMETGSLLYPTLTPTVVEDFRECDFGSFEGKNYMELSADGAYRRWVESNGTLPFPDGEAVDAFKRRCTAAFVKCMEDMDNPAEDMVAAIIAHGGTIMAIMEQYAVPKRGYYDYQAANGLGYEAYYRDGVLSGIHALEEV